MRGREKYGERGGDREAGRGRHIDVGRYNRYIQREGESGGAELAR